MQNNIPVVVGIGKKGIEVVRFVKGLAYPSDPAVPLGWLGVWASAARKDTFETPFPLTQQEVVRLFPVYDGDLSTEYHLPWWNEDAALNPEAARLRGRLAWFWDREINGTDLIRRRFLEVIRKVTERDLSRRLRVFLVADVGDPLFPLVLDFAAWLRGGHGGDSEIPQHLEISLLLIGEQNNVRAREFGGAALRELARILEHPYQGWLVTADGERRWLTKHLFDYVFVAEVQEQSAGFKAQALPGTLAAFVRWLAIPQFGTKIFEYLTNQLLASGQQGPRVLRFALWRSGSAWTLYRPWCIYKTLYDLVCVPHAPQTLLREDFFAEATGDVHTLFLHLQRKGQGKTLSTYWDESFVDYFLRYAVKQEISTIGTQICWGKRYLLFVQAILDDLQKVGEAMRRSRHRVAQAQSRILLDGVARVRERIALFGEQLERWHQALGTRCEDTASTTEGVDSLCAYLSRQNRQWEAWVASQKDNGIYDFWEGENVLLTCEDLEPARRFRNVSTANIRLQWLQEGLSLRLGDKTLLAPVRLASQLDKFARGTVKHIQETLSTFSPMMEDVDCSRFDSRPEYWFSAQCRLGCGGGGRLLVLSEPKRMVPVPYADCLTVRLEDHQAYFGLLQVNPILLKRWNIWQRFLENGMYTSKVTLHPFLAEYFAVQEETRLPGRAKCWKKGPKAFTPSFTRFWVCPRAVKLLSNAWIYGWIRGAGERSSRWILQLPGQAKRLNLNAPSSLGANGTNDGAYWIAWLEQLVAQCVQGRFPFSEEDIAEAVQQAKEAMTAERWRTRREVLLRWQNSKDDTLCSWAWFLEGLFADQ